ncbi:hypothetical protein KIPB_014831, partial [Kipferlia bialata]|eukprot:g14831.t1
MSVTPPSLAQWEQALQALLVDETSRTAEATACLSATVTGVKEGRAREVMAAAAKAKGEAEAEAEGEGETETETKPMNVMHPFTDPSAADAVKRVDALILKCTQKLFTA